MPRVSYDARENIIDVDLQSVRATPALVDEVIDKIIAFARPCAKKPYVLTCWQGVEMDAASAQHYGLRMSELKPLIRGVARWGEIAPTTKAQVRGENVKHQFAARTRFYATREEALAACRRGEIDAPLSST